MFNRVMPLIYNVAPIDFMWHVDGLVQDCSISIAKALEIL